MIRIVFVATFLASMASTAYANLPSAPQATVALADCEEADGDDDRCTDQMVTRGHADLATRHIAAASADGIMSA